MRVARLVSAGVESEADTATVSRLPLPAVDCIPKGAGETSSPTSEKGTSMSTQAKATTYEHDHFTVRFTCQCGKKHNANFSRSEHFSCTACGRRHFPSVKLVTHERVAVGA